MNTNQIAHTAPLAGEAARTTLLLDELVKELGLTQHLPKKLDMLSTGSRRKVWLAAAFASGAALTLLDQPFAALDKTSIALITDLLGEASQHSARAWVVADFEAPPGVGLAATVTLPIPRVATGKWAGILHGPADLASSAGHIADFGQ